MTAVAPKLPRARRLGGTGELQGRRFVLRGAVQGVGFRPWVYRLAREEGLAGWVRNDTSGVTIEAFGSEEALERFTRRLQAPPPPSEVTSCRWRSVAAEQPAAEQPSGDPGDFVIVASAEGAAGLREGRRLSIPADLGTCPQCLDEAMASEDRRYRYPFTNCTHCGPRFTLATGVPYDRPLTTMSSFELCPQCRREYEDPEDRRFHAQPNACPQCGPRLWLTTADGAAVLCTDPLDRAGEELAAGRIVAVKGLGGFHLACDAASSPAVQRLRRRKGREAKPLAVMVPDLETARRYARLSEAEEALLASPQRPIVLVERREQKRGARPLAPEVAPDLSQVGLMLAYTPLHHLLLEAAAEQGCGPLVMTSGNGSGEPMIYRNDEALNRLASVADFFLLHDRDIAAPCDDSVARVVDGAPLLLRRSRGYVPRPITLRRPLARPVLACGGQLKNTFCIGVGDAAYLGPHVGDLESLEGLERLEESVAHLERLLQVRPEVTAVDLHPEYLSSRYGRSRPGRVVEVQHHHAHVVSALAEHGADGPALALAWDGVGYGPGGNGPGGTAWGGELLWADRHHCRRLATFRPLPLAGGDLAVREVWRLALALVDDAFDGSPPVERLAVLGKVPEAAWQVVGKMIRRRVHAPPAHGVGRLFDAVGALLFAHPEAAYEGQLAMMVESCADASEAGVYPWRLERGHEPWEIDLRPAVRQLVGELLAGTHRSLLAARFHNTLAAAGVHALHRAGEIAGELPVVLTGGCFQNALLTRRVRGALALHRALANHPVLVHSQVPAGDGGLALGQAVIADAFTRRRSCA
ncbi:MAG: carbamoyltransferase HypF [Acidobacteriota bacterium]|nr:carbamoyltransferase HypF [Acidobacteriota bacterium]